MVIWVLISTGERRGVLLPDDWRRSLLSLWPRPRCPLVSGCGFCKIRAACWPAGSRWRRRFAKCCGSSVRTVFNPQLQAWICLCLATSKSLTTAPEQPA